MAQQGMEGLSPREREVLALVAEGLTNQLIARRLGISVDTAKEHVSTILEKLNVGNRAAAAVWHSQHAAGDGG